MRTVKIVVLDEPTSNIDATTDACIQDTLRRGRLAGATILTIAHRLHTIADYGRIAVMDSGELVEVDSPATLLADTGSQLYKIASELGKVELAHLQQLAGVAL